jgi:hypothetical protein
MTNLTTRKHFDTNPARPGAGKGPTWPTSLHDHLPLPPPYKTVGETPTEVLRGVFAKLNIADAHTAGRHILCEAYARMLMAIGEAASERAIAEWLEKHRG